WQEVEVEVKFPTGLWTQWYPQVGLAGPRLAQTASPPRLRDGRIAWSATVLPPEGRAPKLPATPQGSLWDFAREVDAAFVSTVDRTRSERPREYERFLFYRGLGEADLPLSLAWADGGTLSHREAGTPPALHLFVLRVEKGRGAYRYLPELSAGRS